MTRPSMTAKESWLPVLMSISGEKTCTSAKVWAQAVNGSLLRQNSAAVQQSDAIIPALTALGPAPTSRT